MKWSVAIDKAIKYAENKNPKLYDMQDVGDYYNDIIKYLRMNFKLIEKNKPVSHNQDNSKYSRDLKALTHNSLKSFAELKGYKPRR